MNTNKTPNTASQPQKTITVICTDTGKEHQWTLEQVLDYINDDRSEDWTNYTASDWVEGWTEWVQDNGYSFEIAQKDLREDYFH